MARYIKRLLPTLLLMAVIISLGAYMLVTMISTESAAQRAWNDVLELDYERADRARSTLTLVVELEALEARAAGESEEARGSEERDSRGVARVRRDDRWW